LSEGAGERGQVCGDGGSGVGFGDRENGVDYVEDAAGEHQVLGLVSMGREEKR
jgi:hypothetical protein